MIALFASVVYLGHVPLVALVFTLQVRWRDCLTVRQAGRQCAGVCVV